MYLGKVVCTVLRVRLAKIPVQWSNYSTIGSTSHWLPSRTFATDHADMRGSDAWVDIVSHKSRSSLLTSRSFHWRRTWIWKGIRWKRLQCSFRHSKRYAFLRSAVDGIAVFPRSALLILTQWKSLYEWLGEVTFRQYSQVLCFSLGDMCVLEVLSSK